MTYLLRILRLPCGALAMALACVAASAQEMPRIEGRMSEGRYLQVLAVGVRDLAVGDAQQKLAIAFAAERPVRACLLELNARGDLTTGIPLPLPLPDVGGQKGIVGEPVATLFHPRLPLLYLWRRRGAEAAKIDTFDHLVVLDVSNVQSPQVVATACSGEAYQSELLPAAMALDSRVRRLFLPNLQMRQDAKTFTTALGYLALDEKGLPVVKPDGELAVTLADTEGVLRQASGKGMIAMGERILLTGSWRGLLYWDTLNRLAAMNAIAFPGFPRDETMIAADARRIYAVTSGAGALRSIRHVAGFPTLLPDAHDISGAQFRSTPVLMTGKLPALAVVGNGMLHIVGLSPDGGFSQLDKAIQVAWLAKDWVPLAYSTRYDRLYLPVEGWP